ncbi:unnamed protein product [Arabidopsis halleri]
MTPYEAVYGQVPPQHIPYIPGESKVAVVALNLQERERMLLILKFHLLRAQHRMEQSANKRRSARSFSIGDWVFVKLQPYRQGSVVQRVNQKLAPKYYGPYKLKLRVGDSLVSTHLPTVVHDVLLKVPEYVLERKMVNRQGRAATKVLVKWSNEDVSEATWEFLFDLVQRFPDFNHENSLELSRTFDSPSVKDVVLAR